MSSTRTALKLLGMLPNKTHETDTFGKILIALTIKITYCHTLLKLKVPSAKKSASFIYHERSFGIVNIDHIALSKNQSLL